MDYERGYDDGSPHDPRRITGRMKHLSWSLLAVAALSAAPGKQTFTGIITDDMCGKAGHSQMRMGPTDAECTSACISAHGATYVLYDGKEVYTLSDQRTPEWGFTTGRCVPHALSLSKAAIDCQQFLLVPTRANIEERFRDRLG